MAKTSILELERPDQGQTMSTGQRGMSMRGWPALPASTRAVVLFLLGRPGSGKSTIADVLKKHSRQREVVFCDDYTFLHAMYETEQQSGRGATNRAQFRRAQKNGLSGFEILDFSVLEFVLSQVNARICQHLYKPNTIIPVEFSRNEYKNRQVWRHFSPEVLMSAHYIFCDATLDTCTKRVGERAQYIPPEIMHGYYAQDGLPSLFQSRGMERVEVVNTNASLLETEMRLLSALNGIFEAQTLGAQLAYSGKSVFAGLPEGYSGSLRH
jgi:deoxyadenosine/deoxycytidine kinase